MSASPSPLLRWVLLALVVALGAWLRTRDLERRPMHADEANQAVKLGELLEKGRYAFDPRDHHGPTLYYAAVPVAWLRGQRTLAALDETTLRLVPALFGTASILLLAALATVAAGGAARSVLPAPGWPALAAAGFLAVSPPAVYYSRYFIQETLLVTFTLAAFVCALRWSRTGSARWAALFGVSAGLMQATKASAPLFLAAGVLALLCVRRRDSGTAIGADRRVRAAAGWAALGFGAAFVVFYSSFFTDLGGLGNALAAYGHAFTRFGAAAPPTGHEKPWWYYLHLFGWFRSGGLVWHQVAFSALALGGFVLAWRRGDRAGRGLERFAAVYTLLVTAAFSFFAYKTPWHAVHLVPGAALLAAGTVAAIAQLPTGRPVAWAFGLITVATLFQQTQRVAYLRPADQRNPYAYVHSSADVLKYRPLAEAAVARAPGQPIRVISEEYWPLPWYFRGFPEVGYYAAPPENCDGALIVASAEQAEAVRARLKPTYRETFLGLRPGVILVLFVATDETTRE